MVFSKLLTTSFQVLVLTTIHLAVLFAFLASPAFLLLPSFSSLRYCSTFHAVPVAIQSLIHLLQFAVHVEACLSRSHRRRQLAISVGHLGRAFSSYVLLQVCILLHQWDPATLDKPHQPVRPPMLHAMVDRCLFGSGLCKNLRRQPDYLSFFCPISNQSQLTLLERSCCGPPQSCDPCHTNSTGICPVMDPTVQVSSTSRWDDPSAGGCYNCEPCYEAYLAGLRNVWIITAIYSVVVVKFTEWLIRQTSRLLDRN